MPVNPAPIQHAINTGGTLSSVWVRWIEALRRSVHKAPSYTVAELPTEGDAGETAFVSDASGGAVLAFFDGTNWRRVTDRAVVS